MLSLYALAALLPAVLAQSTYYGCYTEIPTRALTGGSHPDFVNMTVDACELACTGFSLFGLEYGGECYCSDSLEVGSFPTFETDCNMACVGDNTKICGGSNRISLYGNETTPPVHTPYSHPDVTAFQSEGCWTEVSGPRALSGATGFSLSDMTVENCGNYCLNSGFTWFGLEYTAECFCGNGLDANSTLAAPEDCFMACSGNPDQTCGGPNRLSVYQWV
ncbi:hypothetical protein QBC35DRAFT_478891 [Podospora australis]|uniref:WSC domain-containing protein n=1 Tax=Podospora australis TaxID=1536484 RepID=A0AAN6WM24_9PEZI|nr:hypothetical protein QBC35DRAFT_478891 [Podospora australis]